MAANDADKVLAYVRLNGPLKAREIAKALGLERAMVNAALHGALRGKVQQSKDYTWSVAGARTDEVASAVPKNSHASLFAYYLDCLSQDDDSGVRVFADSKFDLDYAEIEGWPFDDTQPDLGPEPVRKLHGRQRRDSRKKTLWLGYPALVRHVRSRKGWEGAFLEPLLIWPLDPDAGGGLTFLPEPSINTRALEGLNASENILEEVAKLAEELGLDLSESPPVDEMVARLRDLRPEWDWKEPVVPTALRKFGELRKVSDSGIYNAAVVVLAERSPFTVGLERELNDLKAVADIAISGSSLGTLFDASDGERTTIEGPLLEPAPLNAEQRTAVRQALTEPLTVITGPPGTGKSQVVTAILINAAWRNLRVLFASKNNKAVDVVMDRVNSLSPQPIMLRLGTRALQEQLAQHIAGILSAQPTESERKAHEVLLGHLKTRGETLDRISAATHEVIKLRNNVDKFERDAERARTILLPKAFAGADKLSTSDLDDKVGNLREAIRQADRDQAPLIARLFWPLFKRARERCVAASVVGLNAALAEVGAVGGNSLLPQQVLQNGQASLDAVRSAKVYRAGMMLLSNAPDLGALSALLAKHTQSLEAISSETWKSWTALLPDRLSNQDRQALGDYAAILRTIAASGDSGTVPAQIWRRYYELVPKTTKALPCWAVTSLSVRGRVPFTAGDFDLVVIDEASQCDVASAIPLLFRAKRAVVIGDPQQLRHISRLSEPRDQALMVKHNILDAPGPSWGYRANSLYDLAAAKASRGSIVALRDHHRSHADIIGFSNNFFYGGRLRVATDYRRLRRPEGPAIRWVNVSGDVVRPSTGGATNQSEAAAIVEELRRIAIGQRFSGEMGVVTPFRAQANLIEELVTRDDVLASVLASRNFICETAHRFQGDERDLILFSPVVSRGTPTGATGFLKGQGNIFNVGITRARGALVVIGDAAACASSGVEYLSAFARYAQALSAEENGPIRTPAPTYSSRDYPRVAHPERVSDWEKVLYVALVDAGLRPIPQYDVDQYQLDLALIRPNGRRLDVEVDGERYHRDWDGELVRRDQLRNLRLIEMGWDVLRFWVYDVRDNLEACVARVAAWVEKSDALPDVIDAKPRAGNVAP